MRVCVYACVRMYAYAYAYACIYVCMYVCIVVKKILYGLRVAVKCYFIICFIMYIYYIVYTDCKLLCIAMRSCLTVLS